MGIVKNGDYLDVEGKGHVKDDKFFSGAPGYVHVALMCVGNSLTSIPSWRKKGREGGGGREVERQCNPELSHDTEVTHSTLILRG